MVLCRHRAYYSRKFDSVSLMPPSSGTRGDAGASAAVADGKQTKLEAVVYSSQS